MTNFTPLNVLFLDTDNAARSILAEAILNHIGGGRFQAFSAGSQPGEQSVPAPQTLQVLTTAGIATSALHCKSWDVFKTSIATPMNLVITLCDKAAAQAGADWPGQPACAHWAYPDPMAVTGSDDTRLEAHRQALHAIRRRLDLLVSLPMASLNKLALQQSAHEIARS